MSSFYTSVQQHKWKTYYRGYKDGIRNYAAYPERGQIHLNSFYLKESQYTKYKGLILGYLDGLKDNGKIQYYNIESSELETIHKERTYKLEFDLYSSYAIKELFKEKLSDVDLLNNIEFNYKLISNVTSNPKFEVNNNKIKIAFMDIETTTEFGFPEYTNPKEKINAISLRIMNDKMHVWCLGDYVNNKPDDVISYCFDDEVKLLRHFIDKWVELDFDIITGWNIRGFDIPYIINRCRALLGHQQTSRLSPFGEISEREANGKFGSTFTAYSLIGIQILDYMELYQKHIYEPRSSYSLNNITNIELGEGKIDYSEYGNLHNLYKVNFQKFIDYNIKDTDLVVRLEEKLKLISLVIHIAYKCGINYEDVASPVRTWDALIYNILKKDKLVLNPQPIAIESSYPGGHVKQPKAGIYGWMASFDVNSLYPNLIRQVNISPETIIDEENTSFKDLSTLSLDDDEYRLQPLFDCTFNTKFLKERNLSLSGNGNLFKKDKQGFLPKIVGTLYDERVAAKKEMKKYKKLFEEAKKNNEDQNIKEYDKKISALNNEQMALKILLNSLYGATANRYFRWYDLRLAKSITLTGQTVIRFIARKLNELLNSEVGTTNNDFVKIIDTDSNYVSMDEVYKKFNMTSVDELDKYIQTIVEPHIENSMKELFEYLNHFDFQMVMKRECIADKAILLNKKKRYVLNVLDNEGVRYAEPKLKIMGLDIVKSSTPSGVKKYLSNVIKIILKNNRGELIDYINTVKDDFKKLPPEEISIPKSVSFINKYLDSEKSIPINSRAAITFNNYIIKKGLQKKYNLITEGSKMNYIYLVDNNPTCENVIGFPTILPRELDLEQYIDYNVQFDKVFISNVKNITDDLEWSLEDNYNIDDLI